MDQFHRATSIVFQQNRPLSDGRGSQFEGRKLPFATGISGSISAHISSLRKYARDLAIAPRGCDGGEGIDCLGGSRELTSAWCSCRGYT